MSDAAHGPIQKTFLHPEHLRLGARMTDFHGWQMPLYYTSILEEHASVRATAGVFDVSHMGQVSVRGPGALDTLNHLTVSNIAEVGINRACYTLFLNEQGGIIDDLIVYRLADQEFLVIVNCGTREGDVAWMQQHQQGRVDIRDISQGRGIVSIQGPQAEAALERAFRTSLASLGRFSLSRFEPLGADVWVSRTGYTGGDGFEFFLPDAASLKLWRAVIEQGVTPIGLGARDTLRLEAGLRLYGVDMDETASPYDADIGWTVAIHKPSFFGKDALVKQKAQGLRRKLVGLTMSQGPMPRGGCVVESGGRAVGQVTSGTFSPLLNQAIGMAYVEMESAKPGTILDVVIRTQRHPATVVKMPFWRKDAPTSAAVSSQQVKT